MVRKGQESLYCVDVEQIKGCDRSHNGTIITIEALHSGLKFAIAVRGF